MKRRQPNFQYSLDNYFYVKSNPLLCETKEAQLQSTILRSVRQLCQTDEVWQLMKHSIADCTDCKFIETVLFPFAGRYFLNKLGIERYIVKQNISIISSDLHRCLLPEIVSLIVDYTKRLVNVTNGSDVNDNNQFYLSLIRFSGRLYFNDQNYIVLKK